jgi:hypothetical protein
MVLSSLPRDGAASAPNVRSIIDYERGGYPTRKAPQDAEWERLQELRALRPRDAVRPPKRLHEAVQEYLTKVVTLTSPDLEDYVAWRLKRPGGLGRPVSRTTVNRDLTHTSAPSSPGARIAATCGTGSTRPGRGVDGAPTSSRAMAPCPLEAWSGSSSGSGPTSC